MASPPPTKLYAHRDPSKLEPYYGRHISAMTTEGLHSKSDIAVELAFRDARIAELEASVAVQLNRTDRDSMYRADLKSLVVGTAETCHTDVGSEIRRRLIELESLQADMLRGFKIAHEVTLQTQSVEEACSHLVRLVQQARTQRDELWDQIVKNGTT